MLDSISDLTKARPHMRTTARFSSGELRAYHEGYYAGCVMALRVAELGIERFALSQKARRDRARQKRTA